MNELKDYLKTAADNSILKYSASKQKFCPKCGTILDWKKTVLWDCKSTINDGKFTLIICKKCHDLVSESALNKLAKQKIEVEITEYKK